MDKLQFTFILQGSSDGKSNYICLTRIGTPDGRTYHVPQEYVNIHHHIKLMQTSAYTMIKKTLKESGQFRRIWISLTKDLHKTYCDDAGNLKFEDEFLEEVNEKEELIQMTKQPLAKLLKKLLGKNEEHPELKNLDKQNTTNIKGKNENISEKNIVLNKNYNKQTGDVKSEINNNKNEKITQNIILNKSFDKELENKKSGININKEKSITNVLLSKNIDDKEKIDNFKNEIKKSTSDYNLDKKEFVKETLMNNGVYKRNRWIKIKAKMLNMEEYKNVFIINNGNFKYDFLIGLDCIKKFKLIQNEKLEIEQKRSESTKIIKEYQIDFNEHIETSTFHASTNHLNHHEDKNNNDLANDRKIALENSIKYHKYNETIHDKNQRNHNLNIGDQVYVENGNRLNRKKMDELKIGPYKILSKILNTIYELDTGQKNQNYSIFRNSIHLLVYLQKKPNDEIKKSFGLRGRGRCKDP